MISPVDQRSATPSFPTVIRSKRRITGGSSWRSCGKPGARDSATSYLAAVRWWIGAEKPHGWFTPVVLRRAVHSWRGGDHRRWRMMLNNQLLTKLHQLFMNSYHDEWWFVMVDHLLTRLVLYGQLVDGIIKQYAKFTNGFFGMVSAPNNLTRSILTNQKRARWTPEQLDYFAHGMGEPSQG